MLIQLINIHFFRVTKILTALLPLLFYSLSSPAQDGDQQNFENLQYMDLGVKQMELGDYESADKSFKLVLESVKVLPAEICYYFGANSFHLKRYKQSINWLNKYIELKGTTGQFFEQCKDYLKKAEEGYLSSSSEKRDPQKEVVYEDFSGLPQIDCGPTGKVICPVCHGQTVIIKKGPLSDEYYSCPYCDTHGMLTCEEYNLLLKGELKSKNELLH